MFRLDRSGIDLDLFPSIRFFSDQLDLFLDREKRNETIYDLRRCFSVCATWSRGWSDIVSLRMVRFAPWRESMQETQRNPVLRESYFADVRPLLSELTRCDPRGRVRSYLAKDKSALTLHAAH